MGEDPRDHGRLLDGGDDPELTAALRKALAARSDAKALPWLAGHLAAAACTGALVWTLRDSPWVLPALVAHGFVLNFLFCPFP